jgi:hypothetical protein
MPNQHKPAQNRSISDSRLRANRVCAKCGRGGHRAKARFCSGCGTKLEEGYAPAEGLKESYSSLAYRKPRKGRDGTHHRSSIRETRPTNPESALAFVTYALVPYLGILFCPGAVLAGGLGLYRSVGPGREIRRRGALMAILLGLLTFVIQLFLWWLLYKIPEWRRRPPG